MKRGQSKNCLWFEPNHSSLDGIEDRENRGYCLKHKPIPIRGKDGRYYGIYPIVDKRLGCGEFRDKPDAIQKT